MLSKPIKVLVIDDDPEDVKLFLIALNIAAPDCQFMHAENGQAALDMLNKKPVSLPDFIFLDLNMPRMNGKECLRELKTFNHLKNIPVIIHTTSKNPKDVIETKALGATCFAIKPLSINELSDIIRFILNEKLSKGMYLEELIEVF